MSISVYCSVPNGNAWITKGVHFAIIRILKDGRYRVRHDCPTHSPYVNNLHHCMNDFLNGGEDYWLSMDDDNPPTNNPMDLVEQDFDLVGFPTPVWHSAVSGDRPFYFNALDAVGDAWKPHEDCNGLQEVDAIGSGCFLVSRRVMETLKKDQPFMRVWNEDGTVEVGGDYSFCRKVKKAGFRIFAHYDYICDHHNELPLLEVIRSFGALTHPVVESSSDFQRADRSEPDRGNQSSVASNTNGNGRRDHLTVGEHLQRDK